MNPARISARDGERWRQRAEQASDAFGLVLILVLTTYVLASLLEENGWDALVLVLATSTTSVVAMISSHSRAGAVRRAIVLSGVSALFALVAATTDTDLWLNLAAALQIALLTLAMGTVLRRVVTTAEIGSRTILGALSVYAVLGLLFTYLYATIARLQSGPFFEGTPQPHGHDFLFFSYTTLTTTGYGNLVPGGQPGRMFAGLEMMIGQIFLVTLVAGLVSLWRPGEALRRRRERREGKTAEQTGEA